VPPLDLLERLLLRQARAAVVQPVQRRVEVLQVEQAELGFVCGFQR
jgi:hypothetical protein